MDGDGIAELIAGAGPGGAPRVSVIRPFPSPLIRTPSLGISPTLPPADLLSFFAYDTPLRGGVSVATTGAGTSFAGESLTIGTEAKVVSTPGAGGGPLVKVLSGGPGRSTSPSSAATSRAGPDSRLPRAGTWSSAPPRPPPARGSWSAGQTYWTLRPGHGRVIGTVAAVDPAGSTITLLTTRSGLVQLRVRADAPIRLYANLSITLYDIPVGGNTHADALLAPDGQVVDLNLVVSIPPPPIV